MNTISLIQMLMGAGCIGLLWKIQRELGGISAFMNMLKDGHDDHESRIRDIESKQR